VREVVATAAGADAMGPEPIGDIASDANRRMIATVFRRARPTAGAAPREPERKAG
jgi:hypothetical protein